MTGSIIRRLNWGCGGDRPEGWINSDRKEGVNIQVCCDILEGLALASDSMDYVVSIHALPEIPPQHQMAALAELHRVLKPGGVLRLALPDAVKGFDAFRRGDRTYFLIPDDDAVSIGGKLSLQLTWYGYSRTLFTPDWVEELLRKTGFAEVMPCEYRQTQSAYDEITVLDNRENESLFVEAVKAKTVHSER